MAVSPDPLRRDRIAVVAQDTGDRYAAPRTNSALMLAESLRDITPEVNQTLGFIADNTARRERAAGRNAALRNQGQALADAVREGRLEETSNPWFMEAYNREAAAIRATDRLQQIQTQSTEWEEQNDPAAFSRRWREAVGTAATEFQGTDAQTSFASVEAQVTQQVLQTNTAQNVQRIRTERRENVSSLTAQALTQAAVANGGALTPAQALAAIQPSREMWIASGGNESDWNLIVIRAVTTASYSTRNSGLLDLLRSIGVDGQAVLDNPSGNGVAPIAPFTPRELPADFNRPPAAPATPAQGQAPATPAQTGHPLGNVRFTIPRGGEYGAARANGPHGGVDMAAPAGTPILAPGAGRVTAVVPASQGGDSGNYVRVDHGNGYSTTYSHMQDFSVQVGDIVAPGQQLGRVGSTGHSTGPHLHWVARRGDTRIDPRSVNYPTEYAGEGRSATAALAQAVTRPPDAPTTPPADPAASPPAPAVPRGPSLYDIAGVAEAAEADRYRVNQAQTDGVLQNLRVREAQVTVRATQAADYLYSRYGTNILLGNYDVAGLTRELNAQGFNPQETAKAFSILRGDTGDSAGLMSNRMALLAGDPTHARGIFDLALEGRQSGYTPDYERRVGEAILRGDISSDDGISMVAAAHSKTDSDEAQARSDRAEARAEARFQQSRDDQMGIIRNHEGLRRAAEGLTANAMVSIAQAQGTYPQPAARQQFKQRILDAMLAYLQANPGDYEGARGAGEGAAHNILRTLPQPQAPAPNQGAGPRADQNPLRGQ